MPKIKANEINLYYEEYGCGNETIVFISGFTADHTVWLPVAKICATHYHVIIFDNRGVGQSDCPDYPYTAAMLTDDTAALCAALNIKRAHFVGNSMGGRIAAKLAYHYPELTLSSTVSNSIIKTDRPLTGFYLHCAGELALRQAAVAPEVIIKMNLGWIFSDNFLNQSGMVERLIKERVMQPYPLTEASFINQSNVGKVFDAGDWLGKITRPCLVIGADEDRICPEKMVHELAQTIPHAQYFCFTGGVGHLPYIEQPEKFSEVILRFIGRVK